MLSANSDSLISSSTTWASVTVFFSLISMAWTSKTTLNKSKSGSTYLIPDLRGNTFSFSPLIMMFAVVLLYTPFICWDCLLLWTLSAGIFFFNCRIIALLWYVGFCHKTTWIKHKYTYINSFLSLPPTLYFTSLGHYRAPGWFTVLYYIATFH